MLTLACRGGVTFMRWVTPDDAALELAIHHLRSDNQSAYALMPAVQNVVRKAVQHPDLSALLRAP